MLNEQIAVLSIAPFFNWSLGSELLGMSVRGRLIAGEKPLSIEGLLARGAIEQVRGVLKVPESTRMSYVRHLREANEKLYVQTLKFVGEAFQGDFSTTFEELFGPAGALLIGTVFVSLSTGHEEDFKVLDELLETSSADVFADRRSAAASLFHRYARSGQGRFALYLQAMSDWARHNEHDASAKFDVLLAQDGEDRIAGISGHLRGVAFHHDHNSDAALRTLIQACEVLEKLKDWDGSIVTRASAVRVATDQFRAKRDPYYEQVAEDCLKAVKQTLEQVAGTEVHGFGKVARDAIASAEASLLLVQGRASDAGLKIDDLRGPTSRAGRVRTATLRARIQRNSTDSDLDLRVIARELREVLKPLGPDDNRELRRQIAIGYNVLSSVQRDFDPVASMTSAELSLAIGRSIKDARHMAHATNSLLQAHIVAARQGRYDLSVDRVRDLLDLGVRARADLIALGDLNGERLLADSLREMQALEIGNRQDDLIIDDDVASPHVHPQDN